MGYTCCVPCCKGNYKKNKPYVSVFKFPQSEEGKQKWIRALKRESTFKPTRNTRVCVKHFKAEDVIREPYCRPKLKEGAVPSFLPISPALPSFLPVGPKYLSSRKTSTKDCPEQNSEQKENEEEEFLLQISDYLDVQVKCEEQYHFSTFPEFVECYTHLDLKLGASDECWTVLKRESKIIFMKIQSDPIPKVIYSVVVDNTLTLRVFNHKSEVKGVGVKRFPMKVGNTLAVQEILKIVNGLRALTD